MRENCFKQKFLDGKATRKDFGFYVQQWHEFGDGKLHEFLGLSLAEMKLCIENPNKFYEDLEHEKAHYEDFMRSLHEVDDTDLMDAEIWN
jgi:hypothetical protein